MKQETRRRQETRVSLRLKMKPSMLLLLPRSEDSVCVCVVGEVCVGVTGGLRYNPTNSRGD